MASSSTIVTVAASPIYIDATQLRIPATVTAIPGASGTLVVAYSTTPAAVVSPAAATWVTWPPGTVSATTANTLLSPIVALRVSAATSTGVVEITG